MLRAFDYARMSARKHIPPRRRLASFFEAATRRSLALGQSEAATLTANLEREGIGKSVRRRLVDRVTLVCVGLAAVAVSGGFLLAHFSAAPTTEQSLSASTLAPEVVYLPEDFVSARSLQRGSEPTNLGDLRSANVAAVTSAKVAAAELESNDGAALLAASLPQPAISEARAASLDIRGIDLTLADGSRLSSATHFQTQSQGDPTVSSYEAATVAVVPEPSAGAAIATLCSVIVLWRS